MTVWPQEHGALDAGRDRAHSLPAKGPRMARAGCRPHGGVPGPRGPGVALARGKWGLRTHWSWPPLPGPGRATSSRLRSSRGSWAAGVSAYEGRRRPGHRPGEAQWEGTGLKPPSFLGGGSPASPQDWMNTVLLSLRPLTRRTPEFLLGQGQGTPEASAESPTGVEGPGSEGGEDPGPPWPHMAKTLWSPAH